MVAVNRADVFQWVVMIGIVVSVLHLAVVDPLFSEESEQFVSDADAWCLSHNGDLYYRNGVIKPGLYCELSNGTSVYLREVVH